MQIESFVLGVLSIAMLTSIVLAVVGMLKISKLEKDQSRLELLIRNETEAIYQKMDQDRAEWRRWLDAHSKDVTMIERTLGNQIGEQWGRTMHELQHRDQRIQDINEHLLRKIDESMKYTDSRIDRTLRDFQEASTLMKKYKQEREIIKEV